MPKFYRGEGFCFLSRGFLIFKFYDKEAKPDFRGVFFNATLREVWPWHSRSKIRKISGKMDFKFCKLTFFRAK